MLIFAKKNTLTNPTLFICLLFSLKCLSFSLFWNQHKNESSYLSKYIIFKDFKLFHAFLSHSLSHGSEFALCYLTSLKHVNENSFLGNFSVLKFSSSERQRRQQMLGADRMLKARAPFLCLTKSPQPVLPQWYICS